MEHQSPTCGVCGCALSQGETDCPMCGTPVARTGVGRDTVAGASEPVQKDPSAGRVPKNAPIQPMERIVLEDSRQPLPVYGAAPAPKAARKRKPLIIAAAVCALALLAIGASVFGAWSGDQELKQRADQSGGDADKLVETRPTFTSGSGNASGALAGGGIVVPKNDAAYIGLTSGVGYQDSVSAVEERTFPFVSTDCALYLNLYDEALYYVAQSGSAAEDALKGTSIRKIKNLQKAIDSPKGAEVLYRASGGEKITSLVVQDGWMYFMVEKEGSFTLMEMPCDVSTKPQELERREAQGAWIFAESGRLYLLTSTASDWKMESKRLDGEQGAFAVCMEGEGRLAATCLHEGALYYSLSEGAGFSHLYRKTEQGEFSEYQDVPGVMRLSASGDMVGALTQQGGLFWVDASTGFSHDVSEAAAYFLTGSDPRKMGMSAYDEWICVRDDKNGMIQYNVNADTLWAYGSSASSDGAEAFGETGPSTTSLETIVV